MGRFINADAIDLLGANGDFASLNLFAYCGNNPVSRNDAGGNLWHMAFGAVLGGLISGVSKAIECIKSGDSISETIGQVLVSTACGAAGGALAATGIGLGGQVLIGAVLGATESAANQMIKNGSIDTVALIADAGAGALGGLAGGKGASHGSKFMAYHRNQFAKNLSLEGIDSALGKLTKHTWQWAKTNLAGDTAAGIIKAVMGNKTSGAMINGIITTAKVLTEAY